MPRTHNTITAADIIPLDQYEKIRGETRAKALGRKRLTRFSIGPHATALFETWGSMWLQIQEMLRIEKGGEAQLADELAAYAPMVPKGRELTMTLLFEIDDPARRDVFLRRIGGIENHISIRVADHEIPAQAEGDTQRTRAHDNKASAVHFLHFDFSDEAISAWKSNENRVMLMIHHPAYGHATVIGPEACEFLAAECF